MSGYIPISREKRRELLNSVGLKLENIFDSIPEEIKLKNLNLPNLSVEGYSEQEIVEQLTKLAERNARVDQYDSYLGAGFYDHYIPSVIKHIIGRQEFLTSYTPYQAEVSQGTLQAIFEWQSYICRLTGLDVSNSSMYDGASAAAEALLLACRQTRKEKVWLSEGLNPQYITTIKTYFHASGLEVELGSLNENGTAAGTYPQEEGYAAFMIQSPNFFGIVEDQKELAEKAKQAKALSVVSADLISLALFKSPGELGVDIACGEAQPIGVPLSFGGPAVGYLASRNKFMRKMPGRIAGQTEDTEGRTAYVLTMQAREQHIRREKATSNICTNQALLATAATVYLALNGASGLREVAEQSASKAIYLQKELVKTGYFESLYDQAYFREFAIKLNIKGDLALLNKKLLEKEIIGGLVLAKDIWLLAVTEKKSKEAMDYFVKSILDLIENEKIYGGSHEA